MLPDNIDIIPAHEINYAKWDACVHNSPGNLIYATKIYLDSMADNWTGIIVNDYDAVLPVAWRKKAGIRYCYDVPFVQQLGWFGNIAFSNSFTLSHLFRFCKYGDYNFHFNSAMAGVKNIILHSNFIIDLSAAYNTIASNYHKDLAGNLKRAAKFSFVYKHANWQQAIEIYQQLYAQRFPHVSAKDYNNFITLCKVLEDEQKLFAREIVDMQSGEILSIALFLKDELRIYNIMNSSTNEGRTKEANPYLLDNVIKEFAGSGLIFDFEGSDIPGVKRFYQKFGATNQPYYHLHFNHLPPPLKWLKR